MSRYTVNKLLWTIDKTNEDLAAFKANPAGFVARWEELAADPVPPFPEGGELTSEEREAVVACDFGRLYALGAHPYLIWHLVRAVLVPDSMTIEELVESYRTAVEPHGHPDYAT